MILTLKPSTVCFFPLPSFRPGNFKDKTMWRVLLTVALAVVAASEPLRYQPQDGAPDVAGTILCPDKMGTCPTGSTCCRLASGRYGCCSFSQATCCSDHLHCCPHGYTCDVAAGTCNMGDHVIAMATKHPAHPLSAPPHTAPNKLCPGGEEYCPDVNTCCRMSTGGWGCCPMLQAVCCSDGTHCCPKGYTCDTKQGTCQKGASQNTWFTVTQAKPVAAKSPENPPAGKPDRKASASSPQKVEPAVTRKDQPLKKRRNVCPGAKTYCDTGRTCCYRNNSNFGCCSYVNGTCCADMKHCCPLGYTCDTKLGKCTKGGGLMLPLGETHESKSNEPEPEDQDDDDDDKRDKTKRGKTTTTATMETSKVKVTVTAGRGSSPKVKTSETKKTKKAVLITAGKQGHVKRIISDSGAKSRKDQKLPSAKVSGKLGVNVSPKPKANKSLPKAVAKPTGSKLGKPSTNPQQKRQNVISLSDEIRDKIVKQMQLNALRKKGSSTVKPKKSQKKVTHLQVKRPTAGKPVPKVMPNVAPKLFPKIVPKQQRKKPLCVAGTQQRPKSCGTTDTKIQPQAKQDPVIKPAVTKTKTEAAVKDLKVPKKTPHKPKTLSQVPRTPSRESTKHAKKPAKIVKPSKMPQVPPTPKLQQKLQAKKMIEPKTSTRLDEGKPKPPPMVPQRAKLKPRVKSVLKPISKPPQVKKPALKTVKPKKSKTTKPTPKKVEVKAPAKKDLKLPVITKTPGAKAKKSPGISKSTPRKPITATRGSMTVRCINVPSRNAPKAAVLAPHKLTKPGVPVKSVPQSKQPPIKKVPEDKRTSPCATPPKTEKVGCPTKKSVKSTTPSKPKANTAHRSPVVKVVGNPIIARHLLLARKRKHHEKFNSILKSLMTGGDGLASRPNASQDLPLGPVGYIVCPDGESQCADTATCCMLPSGEWGCCPLPKAICCSDDLHCCPYNTECDVTEGFCKGNPSGESQPWATKVPSLPADSGHTGLAVTCFDEISTCPDGYTCCQIPSGVFMCCPMTNAICCQDHIHCCPENTMCNEKNQTCDPFAVPWTRKVPAIPVPRSAASEPAPTASVTCGDNKTACQEGTTCCKMLDGYYSCCPFPDAVCCQDQLHCCQKGETCDIKEGRCKSGLMTTPWADKLPGTPAPPTDVVCPGGGSSCPSGSTCCATGTGSYACCPMPQAVCCSDHTHCCPHGYKCDVSTGTCSGQDDILPLFTKAEAQTITRDGPLSPVRKTVICPDKSSYCPDKTTCCQLPSKQYGCCPLPDATCCPDKTHCCPSGYTCDSTKASCLKAGASVPWAEKTVARPVDSPVVGAVVCPDKKSQCQDQYTCCKLKSGAYGCCPIPKATCCADGLHCCPNGMRCDTKTAMCLSSANSLQVSWSNVRRTLSYVHEVAAPVAQTETCGDKKTECPQGSTCCQMKSGRYGCCPYTKATCCSDHVHCCPGGFQCDSTGTRCDKKDSSLTLTSTMFTRFQATAIARSEDAAGVMCPGGKTSCQSGQTCCLSKSGTYGCCPFPTAVCCNDGTHCCPQGYACDLQSGTCTQAVPWVSKIPAIARQPAQAMDGSVMCPNEKQQCPVGNTCCLLESGEYGCCPLPEAVCCSDGQHCCPHGYQCSSTAGMCMQTSDNADTWQQASTISIATDTYSEGNN